MLRDILQNTTVQLRAWLAQKNLESKFKAGQIGVVKREGAQRGFEDFSEVLLFSRTELLKFAARDGTIVTEKKVTTNNPQDDMSRHYLLLRDKIDQIRKLQAFLGDIGDELAEKYTEMIMLNGQSGPYTVNILTVNPENLSAKKRGDRTARRARLGLAQV